MQEEHKEQLKYLDKKIESINFWVGRMEKNDCMEEWGLKLLEDKKMMNEIRDSLQVGDFDLVNLPSTRLKEEHYNSMQGSEWHKDYFNRKIYGRFLESRPLEDIEKYMEIKIDVNEKNEVTASANWKDKK